MQRTRVDLNIDQFPDEISRILRGAAIYDSSSSREARVYFVDRGPGFFLKEAAAGSLASEYQMHLYFHSLGLTSPVVLYSSAGDRDHLITERVPGEDCTRYLNDPCRLSDTTATLLRMLHRQPTGDCPVQDRIAAYVQSVRTGHDRGQYEHDLFEGIWAFPSRQAAWAAAREGMGALEQNVLMHGDYCLPNIVLDGWKLSGFIDLGNGGIGDRHIDVLWGIWTLKYNLKTARYSDRFLDAYGRDAIDTDKLRCIAAMEMFGG